MSVLDLRKNRAASAWQLKNELALIACGDPIPIPGGLDQRYEFRPHPDYFWLTDSRRPGGVLAFDPLEGWFHFQTTVSEAEQVWEGKVPFPVEHTLDQLPQWLKARTGRPIAQLGSPLPEIPSDCALSAHLAQLLFHIRRRKDGEEIARIRRAVAATAHGFSKLPTFIKPGVTERQVKLSLEAAFFEAGADKVAYDTIVGAGSNSAILHFPPSLREIRAEDLVLIDAGADIGGYVADVTRSFAGDGTLRGRAKALYDVVLHAQRRAITRCRPGTEWTSIHLETARDLCQGLIDLNILLGPLDARLEDESISLFFPHGIGHMVGFGVRDASGVLPGRSEAPRVCGSYIRADLPLEEGYLMTIEPGLYFIPPILNNPERRRRYHDVVLWDELESWLPVGGVRIEDNVLTTVGEPDVLTAMIPK
ncbi:MAG: M24 family metallopeptidase [Bdellovibrionota bacterium]|nr:MAG: M24 family metallopeptidase [Bdellovibrionota bacterium]